MAYILNRRSPTLARPTNKQDELQQLIDERATDENLLVQFRRFIGWFAEFPEPRHFGDTGVFLGKNVTEATWTIKHLWPLK